MLIRSAAHFVVCACGLHGKLFAADGSFTGHLRSKEQALNAMDRGVERGKITEIEIPELRRQIMESKLPRYTADVSTLANVISTVYDAWEEQFLEDDEAPEHRIH